MGVLIAVAGCDSIVRWRGCKRALSVEPQKTAAAAAAARAAAAAASGGAEMAIHYQRHQA